MTSEEHGRVIVHMDIDAFYAQVEEVAQPEYKTKPLGVYQKTIIVTSNYVAREYGIKKCMLTTEAIKLCPNLVLVNGENLEKYRQVSQDITKFIQEKYKIPVEKLGFDENFLDISKLVEEKLNVCKNVEDCSKHTINNEAIISDEDDFSVNPFADDSNNVAEKKKIPIKRKIDELDLVYVESLNKKPKLSLVNQTKILPHVKNIDLEETDNPASDTVKNNSDHESYNFSNVVGHLFQSKAGKCTCGCITRITIGSHIANDIRKEIFETYNLTLSAGISYNKLLAKLVSSLHKPNQQTVLFPNAVLDLLNTIHLKQIPGIGSKMYDKLVHNLNIKTIEDLQNTSKVTLHKEFDVTTADWLVNVAYGRDPSKVKIFSKQSSIGVEDRYHKPIMNLNDFTTQLKVLLNRLLKLIRKDGRIPRLLKMHLRFDHFKYEFKLDSKQCPINSSIFSNSNKTNIENYLLDMAVKLYKELCIKRNSHTITYINIALANFIDVANSKDSILKFCQKNTNVLSKEKIIDTSCSDQIKSSDSFKSNLPNESIDKIELFKDSSCFSNRQSPMESQDVLGEVPQTSKNNFHIDVYGPYQQQNILNLQTNSLLVNTLEPYNSSRNTFNNINIDNIDPDVLNELPDDIRKEIEQELNNQRFQTASRGSSSCQNKDNKTSVSKNSRKDSHRKTVKQLSMLNFVQKK